MILFRLFLASIRVSITIQPPSILTGVL
jgi:hypothetical protein